MSIAPGTYTGRIVDHWFDKSSKKNTPGLWVKIAIAGEWEDEVELTGTIWLSENAMGMARKSLRACGLDLDKFKIWDLADKVSLVGNQCSVTLEEEEYKGRTTVKITGFGSQRQLPTMQELVRLQAALDAAKKDDGQSSPPFPTPTAEPDPVYPDPNAQATREEIPF